MLKDRADSKCLKCGAPTTTSASWGYCAQCLIAGLFSTSGLGTAKQDATTSEDQASSPSRAKAPDSTVFGNYDLLAEIARGGMGVVYKARQKKVQRVVALKMVLGGKFAGDADLKRFRIETEAVTNLDHPNIVPIYEVGDAEGRPYFTMKLIEGGNLAGCVERFHKDPRSGAKLIATVARAVHHAHQRGVLHRDLKPANILLDAAGEPFITDFGLARSVEAESDLTITGTVLGTPNFMAPEQAAGNSRLVSTAADIYSLGAILYYILTNRPPFLAATALETLRLVQESAVTRPSSVHLRTDRDLETICLKCLEKEPGKRYGSALALAEDLERWLRHENILARRPPPAERALKWVKRKPVIAGLGAAILLLLLTVAIGSPIALFRIDRESKRVKEEGARADQQRQRAVQSEAEALSQLYTARISSAQTEWERSHFILLKLLLDQTRNDPNRGFEWYFWRRQMHLALTVLRGHLWTVTAVAFSPDGRRIVTGGDDRTAIIWDAESFREVATLNGHRASIRGVAWTPDSQRIITGGDDHSIRLWDAIEGKELGSVHSTRGRVSSVAVSPDGQRVVSGNQDGTATLWDLASFHPLITFEGHTEPVLSVRLSADGHRLATGSADGTSKVWDASNGQLLRTLEGHSSYVRSVAFSRDGHRIVTGSDDRSARVWDASSGQLLLTLPHLTWVRAAEFSPDSRWIASADDDGALKLWQFQDGREIVTLRTHEDQIRGLSFSPDGQRLISGSRDQVARIWKLGANLDYLSPRGHGDQGSVNSVAFSEDSKLMVTGGHDGVRVWDARSGREARPPVQAKEGVLSVAFSPDDRKIVTTGHYGIVHVWKTFGDDDAMVLKEQDGPVWSAAFSPDGRRIVTGGNLGEVKVWDAATARELLSVKAHANRVGTVAYSPDGRRIASASYDQRVQILNAETGQVLLTLAGHSNRVYSLMFSLDSKRIVTGSEDRRVKVWNAESGAELLELRGHSGRVTAVAFSPDGGRILTTSYDGTTKLWHATNGALVLTLPADPGLFLHGAAFSPDGRRIAVVGDKGSVRIWDAVTAEQVSAWDEAEQQAEQRVALLTSERLEALKQLRAALARDVGALRQWLLLSPISLPPGDAGPKALDEDLLPPESQLHPRAGDRVPFAKYELTWRPVQLDNPFLDLNKIIGHVSEYSAAYAVCYIDAETDQNGLRLLVGSDDLAKIYLNGREVYQSRYKRGYAEDEDTVEGLRLNAGKNAFVLKLVNVTSEWMASVRLTDAAGNPVQGIKVSLTP